MHINRNKMNLSVVPLLTFAVVTVAILSLIPASIGANTSLAADPKQEAGTVIFRQSGFTGEDVPLAGPGEWAQALVEISGAPNDAVISYMQVKYSVVYPQPGDLEVQLQSSRADVTHNLWNRENVEGVELSESAAEITTFQGAPVNGVWSLAVKGGKQEGYIDGFSINVYYETDMPVPRQEGGTPGQPGFLRLPEDAAPVSPSQGEDAKPGLASVEGSPIGVLAVPPGATIIETENFEGTFSPPTTPPGWNVWDASSDGYERYWDDVGCNACGDNWAAWPADGGANGVWPCAPNNYPNDMDTWMSYGPFDLSDATNAGTEFNLWRDIEVNYDWLFFGVSEDGSNFTGFYYDGTAGCELLNIDLSDWAGDDSVWVAWAFYSDYSVNYRGPFVDDIAIWKRALIAPWSDDIESGVNGWTADGFWHQVHDESSPYPNSHSLTHSWWYGQDATGNYDNGAANAGGLTSPVISIPSDASVASLSFWSWYQTETTSATNWDQRWVQISVDGGPFQNLAQLSGDSMLTWVEHTFDLSPYAGSQVRVRFYFDTFDANSNGWRGWYIDDVLLDIPPLVYDNNTIDDDNNNNSSGNNDGIVDPGEAVELWVALSNQGSSIATGVSACISTSDPYVTFIFNTCSNYPDIPSGGIGTNIDDFDLTVDPSAPIGHVIHFDLDITASTGGPWSDSFDVLVGVAAYRVCLPLVVR